MAREIHLPLEKDVAAELLAGEEVELVGDVITGRDQACGRIYELLRQGREPPVDLEGQLLYFGRAFSRQGWSGGRFGRSHHQRPHESLHSRISGPRSARFHRQRLRVAASQGCPGSVRRRLPRGQWRHRCPARHHHRETEVIAFAELLSEAVHRMRFNRFPGGGA